MGCCFFKKNIHEIESSDDKAKDPKVGNIVSTPNDKANIKIDP
jgi:hypothetical protein